MTFIPSLNAISVDPTAQKPWYAGIAEGIIGVINSQRIADENRRRIAAGLPPLTDKEIKALTPATNVQVELPPEIRALIFVGGGLAILWAAKAMNKRR